MLCMTFNILRLTKNKERGQLPVGAVMTDLVEDISALCDITEGRQLEICASSQPYRNGWNFSEFAQMPFSRDKIQELTFNL